MPTTTAHTVPRVWIGCMTHYADRLIGRWFDAVDAPDVTRADVRKGSGRG